jgi:exonuclease III
MVNHINGNQSRNCRAHLLGADLAELTTQRLLLRDRVTSLGTPKTIAAQTALQDLNRQIDSLSAEIKELCSQQNSLFTNVQPLTMTAPKTVKWPSGNNFLNNGEDFDETEEDESNTKSSRKRLRTEQRKEVQDSQEKDEYDGCAQPMDIMVISKETLPAEKTHLSLTQTVTHPIHSLPMPLQTRSAIPASPTFSSFFHLQSHLKPLHIVIQLLIQCFSIFLFSFLFFRPRLKHKKHSSLFSTLAPRSQVKSPTRVPQTTSLIGSWTNAARVRFLGTIARDNVKPVIVLRRNRKTHQTRSIHRRTNLQYVILACILALFIPQIFAVTTTNGITIWMLNMAGTGTTLKMNSVHNHVMNGNPDIFVLTDTRSDGSTLKSQWDWKDYQVREQKGYGRLRNGGIVIGVKRHLPIIQEHVEVPGMDGRLLHITIKTVIRGKGTRIKVIGIYAPPCASESAAAGDFFQAIRSWMDTLPTKDSEWIIAGNLNLSLSRTEASDRTYHNHRSARTEYWKILSLPKSPGFDWWTKRERNRAVDFTRRRWGQVDDTLSGKSIIDRVASSLLFESTEIRSRPDLFIGNTDHVWVHASAKIRGLSRQEECTEAVKQ